MQHQTEVMFLGTASVIPEMDNDTASLLINQRFLVDTGWQAPLFMRQFGRSPLNVDRVFLTHLHHDHYLGLAQLLFFWFMNRDKTGGCEKRIYGPKEDLERVLESTFEFLRREQYAREWAELNISSCPLTDQAVIDEGDMKIEAYQVNHTIPCLGYIFNDLDSRAKVAVTGDTACCEALTPHIENADLLIHEVALGANENSQVPGHSNAKDAARLASQAKVKKLAITHCPVEERTDTLALAQTIFHDSTMPQPGEIIRLNNV